MGDFTVTLLGTGTPTLTPDRLGISTLIKAGGTSLLFDCGRAAALRLHQAEGTFTNATDLFLIHLHSDHVSGISDLWLTGLLAAHGARKQPLKLYGPHGTAEMAPPKWQHTYNWRFLRMWRPGAYKEESAG